MKPNRLHAILALAALVVPAVIMVTPEAEAAERFVDAPEGDSVFLQAIPTTSVLYISDIGDPTAPQTVKLGLTAKEPKSSVDGNTCPTPPNMEECKPRPRSYTLAAVPSAVAGAATPPEQIPAQYKATIPFNPYATSVGGADSLGVRNAFTVRGQNAVSLSFYIKGTPGLDYVVRLLDGTTEVATATLQDTLDQTQTSQAAQLRLISGQLAFPEGVTSYRFDVGDKPTLEIYGRRALPNADLDAGSWELVYDDRELAPSRLTIEAADALQVAAWTQNRVVQAGAKAEVKKVFRNETNTPNFNQLAAVNPYLHTIDGRFAIRSAFGIEDTATVSPIAQITYPNETALKIRPWKSTDTCANRPPVNEIPLVADGIPNDAKGLRQWRFQRVTDSNANPCLARDWWEFNHTVDFAGQPTTKPAGGEYVLRVRSQYDPSSHAAGATPTAVWSFVVSAVGVDLAPFSYTEGATTVAELPSHQLASSGSTTYLLALKNNGAANDTIRIDTVQTFRSSTSHTWAIDQISPVLGDVQVVGANLFRLGPGNSTVLAVTIRAPAATGAQASYSITATSTTDPNSPGSTKTVVLTAGPTFDPATPPNVRGVGAILLRNAEKIKPGTEAQYSAFVWNRGVMPADINVNLTRESPTAHGWNATILDAGRPTENARRLSVPAGSVAGVSVRFKVDTVHGSSEYPVRIKANLVSGGVPEAVRRLVVSTATTAGFVVDVLDGIGGTARHYVEVSPQTGATAGTLAEDHLHGTWYRLWITNTGAANENFLVMQPVITEFGKLATDTTPVAEIWSASVGHRDLGGKFTGGTTATVAIEPGRTAEVYVWIKHNPDQALRAGQNTLKGADVSIRVQNTRTGEIISKPVKVEVQEVGAAATGRVVGVLVEPVGRIRDGTGQYPPDKPYVDISQRNSRTTTGLITSGQFKIFKLRVTNGASWWTYGAAAADVGATGFDHRVNMTITGVDFDSGWTAYFRFASAGPLPASCSDPALQDRAQWKRPGDWYAWPPTRSDAPDATSPIQDVTGFPARDGFSDGEAEILVCAPGGESTTKPLAGQVDQITFTVKQRGPGNQEAIDFREITSVIAGVPKIVVTPRVSAAITAVKGEAIVPVFLANNGSYQTNLTIETRLRSPNGWGIVGNTITNLTPIRAFENRTLAIRVQAPLGNEAATDTILEVEARYPLNLYDPNSVVEKVTVSVPVRSTTKQPDFDMTLTSTSQCPATQGGKAVTCTAQLQSGSGGQIEPVVIPVQLTNRAANQLVLRVSTPTMPGWVFQTNTFSFTEDVVLPTPSSGGSAQTTITVRPPREAVSGSVLDLVITAVDKNDNTNVQVRVAKIIINGGLFDTSLSTVKNKEFVQRDSLIRFPVTVRNDGNVDGTVRLVANIGRVVRAESVNDPKLCSLNQPQCWDAWLEDLAGVRLDNNTDQAASIFLRKNELRVVNLTVKAPFYEQENAFAEASVRVFNATNTLNELGKIDVRAEIQDYGVEVTPDVDSLTLIPGHSGSIRVFLKNTGDANDTLNLSVDTGGLPWRYTYSSTEVLLTPGTTTAVRLTIQSPTDPLPQPRTAKFFAFLGTRGGQAVNVSKYDSKALFVVVPQYRQADVDRDNVTELAVDANRDLADGYESFYEYSNLGRVTRLVDKALGKDRHTKMFLDLQSLAGTYNNIADVFWDPDQNFVSSVQGAFDLDKEGTSDYLLDTDSDGVVDTTYQAATRSFLKTDQVRILDDQDAVQYLVDTNGDGKPDRYYDPASEKVTRLQPAPDLGANVYGIDTDDDGRIDRYYDYKTQTVTPATGIKAVDFLRDYWYVAVGFVAVVVVFVVVLMRRRPGGGVP